MCGVAGIYHRGGTSLEDVTSVRSMLETIEHRGPDGSGIVEKGAVVFGHRLLAITGVGTGDQPLCNEDGTVWVSFNGEIYNHRSLRRSLEKKGHYFQTETDTEVLVHLYEEYKDDLVHHLNGMFAFVIWDTVNTRLIMARDRLGVKPLFYASFGDRVVFGSELKAVRSMLGGRLSINEDAILNYLQFKHVGAHRCIYSEINKVPPGYVVKIDEKGLDARRYWTPVPRNLTGDYSALIRETVADATKIRLRSDVPLSISLSGGIDSSIVLYEAAVNCGYTGETFSIRYPEAHEDESGVASRFAESLGIRNTKIDFVDIDVEFLPSLVRMLDEPFGDYSAYPTYFLFREQKKFSTVVLTGDGGDEAFGGYQRYIRSRRLNSLLGLSSFLAKSPNAFLKYLPRQVQKLQPIKNLNAISLYQEVLATIGTSDILQILQKEYVGHFAKLILSKNDQAHAPRVCKNYEALMDYHQYLPGDVLSKVDMMSMASSVEARSPFLDFRIAELGLSLPVKKNFGTSGTKLSLKNAYQGLIPSYILEGKKRGFTVPQTYWQTRSFENYCNDMLLGVSNICEHILDRRQLEIFLQNAFDDKTRNLRQVWNLLMLELWLQNHRADLV